MGLFGVVRDGVARVNRAPAILAGVWLLTLVVSLPLAIALRSQIATHLGDSMTANRVADGVDYEWMQEFTDQASGVGVTLTPRIIGFAAVLDNASAFLDNTSRPVLIIGAAAAYIGLWIFLAGGIIDRFARDRAVGSPAFFSACGTFFFRFLRLALVQALVYGFLFGPLHGWLFDRLYPRMIHDVTVERTAFLARVALYVVFGVLVAAANVVFDYAKVRAVVEDRRSMVGAISSALGFIERNYAAAVGVYLINFCVFLLAVGAYASIAPGVEHGALVWIAFAIAQCYVVARLWVKLLFWASETALFQSRLAHAGYVARPLPAWPDSPAASAI
ncbi:MAG TPA: hypothetical protein VFA59_09720 [Vicinamibacterales bacterium]|nr:hypothetical protein [Vicinamibacterales bacterium]